MDEFYSNTATNFLELASEQRLVLLHQLMTEKLKLSQLTKKFNSTKSEIHRNLGRLIDADMVEKDKSGLYELTSFGYLACSLIPSFNFVSQNKKYFKNHSFGNLELKFIQRIGDLSSGKLITGFSRVLEKWSLIFNNSENYISSILVEEPMDLIEPLVEKAKKGIKVNSIFSNTAIIPEGRKKLIHKHEIQDLIRNKSIERRIKNGIQVVVVLNEKEACVMFPTNENEPDISKMFYGNDPNFHEWCFDFFEYCWKNSELFQEKKLKERTL